MFFPHLYSFILAGRFLWHDMGICCVGVGKCQSEDSFVCFGVKPTQRAYARDLLRGRNRTREGRSPTEQIRRRNREVGRTGQSAGESRRLLGCEDPEAGLANVRRWVSIPGGFVGISLEYTLTIAHRILGKCHKLLVLGANPSPCLFSFLPPPLGCVCCVLCVRKKKVKYP